MSLQPTFAPRKPVWRGNSSSADMNSNFEEILYDLNSIFAEAAAQAIDLDELKSIVKHEVVALGSRVETLTEAIASYEANASGYKMFHEEFFRTTNIDYPGSLVVAEQCNVNTLYGQVTLPIVSVASKAYTIDISTGDVYQSPDLDVSVTSIDEDGYTRIDETNALRAFNSNNQSYWERKVRYPSAYSKDSVTCRLNVTLPSMSNQNVNAFYVLPYPEGTVNIEEITYDTASTQDNSLPTFPTVGDPSATKAKYLFSNIQPISFKVKMKQISSAIEDDLKTFTYGAQEIGIEREEYRDSGKVGVKFQLPDYEEGLIKEITSISSNPGYDDTLYKLSIFTSEANFDSNTAVWDSSQSAITASNKLNVAIYATDTVWVMAELTKTSGSSTTPVLKSITVTYTTT